LNIFTPLKSEASTLITRIGGASSSGLGYVTEQYILGEEIETEELLRSMALGYTTTTYIQSLELAHGQMERMWTNVASEATTSTIEIIGSLGHYLEPDTSYNVALEKKVEEYTYYQAERYLLNKLLSR